MRAAAVYRIGAVSAAGCKREQTALLTHHAARSGQQAVADGRHTPTMHGYGLAWLTVALFVLAAQLVNSIAYQSDLRHLTNWAWILNLVGLVLYMLPWIVHIFRPSSRAPRDLPIEPFLLVWGVTVFVASGITYITLRDNSMLVTIERHVGTALFWSANVLFHYFPVLLWTVWIYIERRRLHEMFARYPIYDGLFALNAAPLYFIITYGVWFNPANEYPGEHLSFETLFVSSFTVMVFFNLFPVALCVNAKSPTTEDLHWKPAKKVSNQNPQTQIQTSIGIVAISTLLRNQSLRMVANCRSRMHGSRLTAGGDAGAGVTLKRPEGAA